jgi:hypothetical protein
MDFNMNLIKSIVGVALFLISTLAVAWDEDEKCNLNTYFGVNYKLTFIKPRQQWNRLLEDRYPGFGLYVGTRFHPYFGAELGYEWTANKVKSYTVNNNTALLNIRNTTGQDIVITAKNRFQSGFIDAILFIPFCLTPDINPEALVSVGVAANTTHLRVKTNPNIFPFTNQFVAAKSSGVRAIPRFGLGIQSLIVENIGLRLMWRWEGTQNLRVQEGVSNTANNKAFYQNANSLSISVYIEV